jgi:hypothetical protein
MINSTNKNSGLFIRVRSSHPSSFKRFDPQMAK